MTTIGSRLRVFAEAQYGSVAAMERALGMAKHLLHKYVRDESKPGAELLQKFRAVGMSIDWLLSGEGDMYRPQPLAIVIGQRAIQKEAEEILLLNLNDPALVFEQLAVFASRLAEPFPFFPLHTPVCISEGANNIFGGFFTAPLH